MKIPNEVYKHYDAVFEGTEYALLRLAAPVATLREEAKSFLGSDLVISADQVEAIWKEIENYDFPVFQHGTTKQSYVGIPGNDFITLIAIFVEL